MHDIFAGVGPMVLKLMANHFVFEERFFNVDYLNGQIAAFNYGPLEKVNKPSANLTIEGLRNVNDHSLNQKAMRLFMYPGY